MERGKRKPRTGVVVSNKMNRTVVVSVERTFSHPLFKKTVRSTSKFLAHDEKQECSVGDLVEIMETRPISKNKYFRVVRVLGKGKMRLRDLPASAQKEEPVDTAA